MILDNKNMLNKKSKIALPGQFPNRVFWLRKILPIKAFLHILSSMDDNFTSIMSFINDKICIFATVFSISTKGT